VAMRMRATQSRPSPGPEDKIEAASSLGHQMLSAKGGAMVASGAWVAVAKPGSDRISVAPARECIRACVPRVVWPGAGEW